MNKPRRARLTRHTLVAAAVAAAAVVTGGSYALASSSHGSEPAAKHTPVAPKLRYIEGQNVAVLGGANGANATKCPKGMYPVSGGPSSSNAVWEIQWSDPDRSSPSVSHPNEWTVGLHNNSASAADFKVFVVCSTASSVSGNY
jgi:hypothetical protein